MPDNFTVYTSRVPLFASADTKITLTAGPDSTLYYGTATVSSSSYTGSLTQGQSTTFTDPVWLVSARSTRCFTTSSDDGNRASQQELDTLQAQVDGITSTSVAASGAVADAQRTGANTYTGTDNTSAFQGALDDLVARTPVHGGVLFVPAGNYLIPGHLSIPDGVSIVFQGEGVGADAGLASWPASQLVFTASGSDALIDARSSQGLTFDRIGILYVNASYTGIVVDTQHSDSGSDAQHFNARQSMFSGLEAYDAEAHISLRGAIIGLVENCHFDNSQSGIRGRENVGDSIAYSNAFTIRNNSFLRTVKAIANPGESWTVEGNTHEGLQGGAPAGQYQHNAVICDMTASSMITSGFAFRGNWCGDAFGVQEWLDFGDSGVQDSVIEHNSLAGGIGGVSMTGSVAHKGVAIRNNGFVVTDYGVDMTGGEVNGVEITGNTGLADATNPILQPTVQHRLHIHGNPGVADQFTLAGHFQVEQRSETAPSIVANAAAGSGATASVATGSDMAGLLTISTGTSATAGKLATVTFGDSHNTNQPNGQDRTLVQLTPVESDAGANAPGFFTPIGNLTAFEIHAAATPADSTQYQFAYFVVQG